MLREKTLTIASHCSSFREFCAQNSAVYEGLRKRPAELQKLREMFEDGSIHTYLPAIARRKDGTTFDTCRVGKNPPELTRQQILEFAEFFDSYEDFRAHAGDYSVVASRRKMSAVLKDLFEKRDAHAE